MNAHSHRFFSVFGSKAHGGGIPPCWLIGWVLLCIPALVFAQSAPKSGTLAALPTASRDSKAADAKKVVALGEVIVTANLRPQTLLEVPMHVTTVSATDLRETGARTLNDYVSYQPGVFFASQGGPGQGLLIMRGVSTGNQSSPTVAMYINGVPVGGSTSYAASATFVFDPVLLDLNHIEFLFGPQGTLYGASSLGGLIKYVTNQPDARGLSGNAGTNISYTQRAGLNYSEHAILNLPLVKNTVAMRVSVLDQHSAGVYRAVGKTPANGADHNHTQGARVQLQFDPTDKLSLNLSAMVQRISAAGLSMADYNLQGQPLSGGPYNRRLNHREPFTQTMQLYAFRAKYDWGWAKLNWISSYQNFVNQSVQDYPDALLALLNFRGPAFGIFSQHSTLYVDSEYDLHKASQEIRLTSRKNEHLDWLAGVWFNRENVWERFALLGAIQPPPGLTTMLAQRVTSDFEEYAGYGDVTWHFTPVWALTAGIRASGNSQHLSKFQYGPLVGGLPTSFRGDLISHDISEMLTLSYRPDKTHSYYMRASTGYRPGGLQAPVLSPLFPNSNAKNTFGPDTLQSYTLGYKGQHMDGHLSVGIDTYDIEWHNIQLYTFTNGNTIIQNVGAARINGLELQTAYKNGPWLVTGAAAYTDARTLQNNPLSGIPAGAPLPYSAKWTATITEKYNFRLARNAAYVGANLQLSSRRNAGFDNDPTDLNYNLPGFGELILDAGMTLPGGPRIDLYLRNALNHRMAIGTLNTQAINFFGVVRGPMLVQQSTPRTIGVSIDVPFY